MKSSASSLQYIKWTQAVCGHGAETTLQQIQDIKSWLPQHVCLQHGWEGWPVLVPLLIVTLPSKEHWCGITGIFLGWN